jgi:alpha-1,2-mannosyltransferase
MAVAPAPRVLQTAEARLKQWRRSLPGEALWIVGLTILLVRGPISVLFTLYSGASDSDFEIFYDAARSWREGGTPYPTTTTGPNLTLPHVMPVFRALSYAPFPVALTLWLIASVAAAWMAVRMTRRTIGLTMGPSLRILATVLALVSLPAMQQLRQAQVGWLLMALFTLAWLWTREDRNRIGAAMLIGALITVKSFFLLWIPYWMLRRRWREAGTAVLSAGVIVAAGVLILGPAMWREWQAMAAHVWFGNAENASIMGVLARTLGRHPPAWLWALAVLPVVAVAIRRIQQSPEDTDRDWALVCGAAFLLSPIGWRYFECLWLAPLIAVVHARGWQWRDLILLAVLAYVPASHETFAPGSALAVVRPWWLQLTTGSIACWSLLGVWAAIAVPGSQAPRPRSSV